MEENKSVYEQLADIQQDLQKMQSHPCTLLELITEDDPQIIEFVKTADRVFIYKGEKSELNIGNKKRRNNYWIEFILALIQIIALISAIYIPYMWCMLILNLFVYSYPIYKAVTFKPARYEIKYDEMNKKHGIYDDNNILCGYDDKKWKDILDIASMIVPILNAVALGIIPFFTKTMHAYFYILIGISVVSFFVSICARSAVYFRYDLYFVKDDLKIPYTQLKEFMQRNNLK